MKNEIKKEIEELEKIARGDGDDALLAQQILVLVESYKNQSMSQEEFQYLIKETIRVANINDGLEEKIRKVKMLGEILVNLYFLV